jgi:hypothetical protein
MLRSNPAVLVGFFCPYRKGVDGASGVLEGILTEAAAYLRLPESEVVGLAHTQGLPGRYVTGEWL